MQINRERLAATFITLCETDSPSRSEKNVGKQLKTIFASFAPDFSHEDDTAEITGADCGNLFFRFGGSPYREPIFFNCHMDTVEPGIGVQVHRENDIFTSTGDTVLGSDDKSGIAALIEAMQVIMEKNLAHCPVEFIFTTCEEIGLLGAKALDPSKIHAKMGYALDSSGSGRVIIGAPAANRINISVQGVATHAGLHPEWGVNAITLAGQALARSPAGRIDEETTVNFGTIAGGVASNIVPELVVIKGEVRSHSMEKLGLLTNRVREVFTTVVDEWRDPRGEAGGVPSVEIDVQPDFPIMRLTLDDAVIRRVDHAARAIGMQLSYEVAGGGSDANIFNGYGLQTAILATGMTHVHSTDEQISLQDMTELTKLIIALLTGDN